MRLGEAEPSVTASVFSRVEKSAGRSRAAGVFASAGETAIPDERSAAAIPAQRELFTPIPGRIAVRVSPRACAPRAGHSRRGAQGSRRGKSPRATVRRRGARAARARQARPTPGCRGQSRHPRRTARRSPGRRWRAISSGALPAREWRGGGRGGEKQRGDAENREIVPGPVEPQALADPERAERREEYRSEEHTSELQSHV